MRLPADSARRVTRRRIEQGFSFRRAAEVSELSTGTWQRIESGSEVEYASLVKAALLIGDPDRAEQLRTAWPELAAALEQLGELVAWDWPPT